MVCSVAVPWPFGRSSVTVPSLGWLTSRSPCGVQASMRASGTLAQTEADQPRGRVRVRAVENAPPPRPAGTCSVTRAVEKLPPEPLEALAPPEALGPLEPLGPLPPQAATARPAV